MSLRDWFQPKPTPETVVLNVVGVRGYKQFSIRVLDYIDAYEFWRFEDDNQLYAAQLSPKESETLYLQTRKQWAAFGAACYQLWRLHPEVIPLHDLPPGLHEEFSQQARVEAMTLLWRTALSGKVLERRQ